MMKKYILSLFFLIPIWMSAQIKDSVHIDSSNLILIEDHGFDRVQYGHDYVNEWGHPELPIILKSYVVPVNANNFSVQINVDKLKQLKEKYFIYPVQKPQRSDDSEPGKFIMPDSTIYASDFLYPNKFLEIVSNQLIQGYRIITLVIYPLSYKPLQKELYVRNLSYTINYELGSIPINLDTKISLNRFNAAKEFVKSIVCNPKDVEQYSPNLQVAISSTNLNGAEYEFKLKTLNNVTKEIVPDYVIITNKQLEGAFQLLANWKIKKGIPTIIKTIEEIQEEYIGSDLPQKVKNYLKDIRNRWSTNSLFVLLGGDVDIIPSRYVSGYEGPQVTDAYFLCEDYDWTPLNLKQPSQVNLSSYLGRIPVKTLEEANKYISKLLKYEKGIFTNPSYVNNFLVVAAFMSVNRQSGQMTDLNNYCKTYRNSSTKYWYMFDHFACTKNDHQKQYYDTTYGEELDRIHFLSALQNGRNWGDFHIVYHMDHSFPTNMGASQRNKGELLSNGDIDELSDNSSKIILSGGCHPADFSRDCIAEHFLKKANGGAVAYIGNTDVGWVGDEYQFEPFLNNLFNNLSSNIFQHTIGYTYLTVVKEIKGRHTKHRLHLLGDPTMLVWTATPQNLNVTITPATVISGPNQITVKVNNLPLGEQALICLMKDEEGYATLTVNDTQPHTFTFTPRTSGILNVTVTAHNFRPYEKTIPVQVNNNTAVYIADLAFDDGGSEETMGDNNGQLDAGETIGLTVKLKNSGKVNYNQVTGILRCTSPYITILNKQSNFGTIPSDGTLISSQTKFRFQIDKDAPEIHRNDLNGIKFFLDIKNDFTPMHTDTFKIDIFAPELELREQVVSFSGNKMGMRINLMNVGKSRAIGVIGVLSSENSNIISISRSEARFPVINKYTTRPNNGFFVCELGSNSAQNFPLNMKLVVKNEYGKTWTFYFDPNDKDVIENLGLGYLSQTNGIELYWNKNNNAKGYNIYRSTTPSGTYTRLNTYPLISNYYKDESILPLTTYYYKVALLSTSMNPSEFSPYVKATSLCPLVDGFPCTPQYGSITNGAINIGDIDYNGVEEIFSTNWYTSNRNGFLIGIDSSGHNLFGANILKSIGDLSVQASGSPAIGDILGKGEQNIVTATWKDTPADQNSIACFSPQDSNEDEQADLLWQTYISAPFYRGVVLANLDQSSDGTMEIVAQSNAGVPIRILDSNGNIKCSLGTGNYSKPAVADLDGDGDMEIIACDENGINIWHHNGTAFATNNPFWCENSLLSSPVICDLNKNGYKEIIVAEKNVSDSHIYVIDLNGNQVKGWDGTQSIPYSSERGSGLDHGLSVGDIDGDGKLEIVALGSGKIRAWKSDGTLLFDKTVYGLFPNKAYNVNIRVPILADVDGDSKADIIYSIGDAIYALRHDGTFIEGFPLKANNAINGTLVVSDIDNDGKNEIIAADNDTHFYAWKTNGDSNAIEWGSERHDSRNTGEYGTFCQPVLIRSNTTWNGETPCGNVIVQSGTLTIPTGKSITLEKTSKIVVRPGATLVVDGGSVLNGYVWALPGSTVTIKNNGTIKLRLSGKLIIESGAIFNQEYGSVVLNE